MILTNFQKNAFFATLMIKKERFSFIIDVRKI